MKRTGLYIHIPFCVKKCNYCAFLSFGADEDLRREYAEALIGEIGLRSDLLRRDMRNISNNDAATDTTGCRKPAIDTVYFGGGTPSVMEVPLMEGLMNAIRENYEIAPDAEITLEANPGTLGRNDAEILKRLEAYRDMGFNRLSMGVQSMDADRLRFLGRIHTAGDVIRDVRLAREAGFDNINLDLIFSVPGETEAEALKDAESIIALGPEHISCYSMQLEEGTPFYEMAERGEISEVPDEEDRHTYHSLCRLLRGSGYEHYEISNFARIQTQPDSHLSGKSPAVYPAPGFDVRSIQKESSPYRSRHNSSYWDMSDYIGAGLGASGFLNGMRYRNITDIREYIRTFESGSSSPGLPVCEAHTNSAFDNISEAVFTGLRRREGITYAEALRAYETQGVIYDGAIHEYNTSGEGFRDVFRDARQEAQQFADAGYLIIDADGLRLTEEGIDISNRIMALFV